jgi:hypothetical protein
LRKFRKEAVIFAAVFIPIIAVIVLWRPTSKIGFVDVRIVNDTHRTVTIQPCWDLNCLDIRGLQPHVVRPGRSVDVTGEYTSDVGHEIAIGIRKRGGKPWQFSSCVVTGTAAGQRIGLVRVSKAQPCFTGTES